jgi:hypothetical protein
LHKAFPNIDFDNPGRDALDPAVKSVDWSSRPKCPDRDAAIPSDQADLKAVDGRLLIVRRFAVVASDKLPAHSDSIDLLDYIEDFQFYRASGS